MITLKTLIKEQFRKGGITKNNTYVCEIANLKFTWTSDRPLEKEEDTDFMAFDNGVFNKSILFMALNHTRFENIYLLENNIEDLAIQTGKNTLTVFLPILHVTCKVSELEGILNKDEV